MYLNVIVCTPGGDHPEAERPVSIPTTSTSTSTSTEHASDNVFAFVVRLSLVTPGAERILQKDFTQRYVSLGMKNTLINVAVDIYF